MQWRCVPGIVTGSAGWSTLATLLLTIQVYSAHAGNPPEKKPLTVADSIQTVRFMDAGSDASMGKIAVSPDRSRYAIRLIRGDLERNGVLLELAGGQLHRMAHASPRIVARFFTPVRFDHDAYAFPLEGMTNPLVWLDNETVAFLWEDENRVLQVNAVNLRTNAIEQLTNHPANVISFAAGSKPGIFYKAQEFHPPAVSDESHPQGFVVKNRDVYSLLRGDVDGYGTLDRVYNARYFVSAPPSFVPVDVGIEVSWNSVVRPAFDASGHYALVSAAPEEVKKSWQIYRPPAPYSDVLREASTDRAGWYGRQLAVPYVVDTLNKTSRPLWEVPLLRGSSWSAAWAPDSHAVVFGPTYLPPEESDDSPGRSGLAIVEVDIQTGRFWTIPVTPEAAGAWSIQLRWMKPDAIEFVSSGVVSHFKKINGRWMLMTKVQQVPARTSDRVILEVREDLNTPPALYAVDAVTHRRRLLMDLNPRLKDDFTLGRVAHITWPDEEGRNWSSLLYYPAGYIRGRRYPLVIQTHGHARTTEFSLYGLGPPAPGLGPGWSVFAAQPLASRGIAVLQMEDKRIPGIQGTPKEAEMYTRAYEAAVRHLVGSGLVEPARVGLVGFSRTGWHVEYALTHSAFPYAAAISSDNISGSYVGDVLSGGRYADIVGAQPIGDGLKEWLSKSPGFNVDKVHTPIRLQKESGGLLEVLSKWEFFSGLRRLNKPVELYVIPDIEHGSHNIQQPAQCLASQEGAVDWFDFWLNGHEDSSVSKVSQYARWHALREMQR